MSDNVIEVSGPLFNGEAAGLMDEMCRQIQQEVAQVAYDEWTAGLDDSIRHNGHVYTDFAQVKEDGPDMVVNDGYGETNELPYGLWLEGTGSRNSPVTVFEGYHALEDAYAVTEQRVDDITEQVVSEYVDRVNNG